MGRTQTLIPRQRSITRQAALRLIFSLGLFVLLLGLSSYSLYSLALQKSAHERAEDLAAFYRTRLMQQEREWGLQARDFRVRLEETHLLETHRTNLINLQAFMTMQGTNRRFQHMLINDHQGGRLFDYGDALDLPAIPIPAGDDSSWYQHRPGGKLYRVFVVPIWLGEAGTGRLVMFFEIDNALLFNLATPGIDLAARHAGQLVASSAGEAGIQRFRQPGGGALAVEAREIDWNTAGPEQTQLCIKAPLKVLFSTTELTLGAALIPIVDGLILWFTLGFWLMHNARRIRDLGSAVEEFAVQQRPGEALQNHIDSARGREHDEISEVACAIEGMAEQTLRREHERQREESQRRLWSMVFANSNEAIMITDQDNLIVSVNEAFSRMTGYSAAEVLGRNPRLLSSGHQSREFYAAMWQQLHATGNWAGEVQDRCKDGTIYPKWLNISVVRDEDERITHYIGAFIDITERKRNEERLAHLASHDPLTGLPNRHLLMDRLQGALSLSQRSHQAICVLFLDLDNFKWVNDTLGHASGDKLLMAVASRLTASVRGADTVARYGGDEFVVVLSQTDSHAEIHHIAEKIIAAVAQPLQLDGHDFQVTTSMGISLYPHDGEDAASLLKQADAAMYVAKTSGKNQYRFFNPALKQT